MLADAYYPAYVQIESLVLCGRSLNPSYYFLLKFPKTLTDISKLFLSKEKPLLWFVYVCW